MSNRLLVVTSRTALDAAYGPHSYLSVLAELEDYKAALTASGDWVYSLLVPDDQDIAAIWGVQSIPAVDASGFAAQIRRACVVKPDIAAVLLVGGLDIIPFWRLPNPVNDADTAVPSDNPYGCPNLGDGTFLTPDLRVGRLTGAASAGLDSLLAHIRQMKAIHIQDSARTGGCAVCAAVWSEATRRVAAPIGPTAGIQTSPTFELAAANASTVSQKFLFFNLHGTPERAGWTGESLEGGFRCMDPSTLAGADLFDSVIFAANCYGLNIDGRRANESCALTATAGGARGFIGSTTFSYGFGSAGTQSLRYAERLAQLFFEQVTQGKNTGGSLRAARLSLRSAASQGGQLNVFDRKTLLQFVLLGDPTL